MSKRRPAKQEANLQVSAGEADPPQPSARQTLTKQTREQAAQLQSATRPADTQPAYNVPDIPKTPDEIDFDKYAASFHKLFPHDTSTGLLTPGGVTSYGHWLKGLNNPPNDPNSDFNQTELNAVTLANPGPDVPPRVLINPQSSKSLTIKGGDVAGYRFKTEPITDKTWQLGYKVVYAKNEADTNALLQELSFKSRTLPPRWWRLTNTTVRRLLERVREVNAGRGGSSAATYLLSQIFPEASPAHPAWPSGHATVAGACVTVIKAIFNDRAPVVQQVECNPSPICANAGNPKVDPPPFTDENGVPLTVGGELDKLASNVALGRNFGGVHFRSDGEHGILLGEKVAIRFLQDHLRTYRERFRCDTNPNGTDPCFELNMRSGQRIRITAETVTPIAEAAEFAAARAVVETKMDRTTI